jgi:hypothetical protein
VEARRRAGAHHQHDPRPAEADGSSDAWTVSFFSASANAHVSVNTFRGGLNCWAQAGSAGRIPDLKPGFVIDGAKLYEIAKQHGDKFLADGYFVQIGTAAAPSNRHATWNIQFTKSDGKTAPVLIVVDANTGKVEQKSCGTSLAPELASGLHQDGDGASHHPRPPVRRMTPTFCVGVSASRIASLACCTPRIQPRGHCDLFAQHRARPAMSTSDEADVGERRQDPLPTSPVSGRLKVRW